MISTSNLTHLPDIDHLKSLLQAMAMLDAVIEPEWEYRQYSFDARWDAGEMMGSMQNGQGDDFFALFSDAGCFLKGYVHDWSPAARKGRSEQLYAPVPQVFVAAVREPAFTPRNITFCIWRQYADAGWHASSHALATPTSHDDPDGSRYLLSPLDGDPRTYTALAESYYERNFDGDAIAAIYRLSPLTDELIQRLNPDISLEQLAEEIAQIGYPTG